MNNDRPNILIITADALRHDAIGIVNQTIKTPHIDRLAADGVAFTHAYCAAPECIPSRTAMLTGLPPHRNGVFANCRITLDGVYHSDQPYELAGGIPMLADMLTEHGYQRLSVGATPYKYNYVGVNQDYLDHLKEHGFGHIRYPRGCDEGGMWYLPQASALPCELHLTHWTADLVIRSMETWRANPKGPFLMEFTFNKPHAPFDPPHPYDTMYNPGRLDPPIREGMYDPQSWPFYHLWQNSGKTPWGKTPLHLARMQRAAYYGSVSFVDDQIGRILEFLAETGLRDRTVVVFTSDHGEMLGDHYLYGKRSWYDGSARVPLVISAPRFLPRGRLVRDAVSHLDLLPTLIELCSAPYDQSRLAGVSLIPLATGALSDNRNFLFGQYGEKAMAVYMCLDRQYKYIYAAADEQEMLFDLAHDPEERHDLAPDSRYASELQRLKAAILSYFRAEGHLVPVDGNDFRRFPLPSIYAQTRQRFITGTLQE